MHRLVFSKQEKMNWITKLLIPALALLTIACTKYEDGPNFSLKTEQSRLCRQWRIQLAYYSEFTDSPENGINETEKWKNFTIEFDKNGEYQLDNKSQDLSQAFSEKGTWEFTDDKIKIKTTGTERITATDTGDLISETTKTTTWRIMQLKRNILWVWYQNAASPPWMYFRMIPS